MNFMLDIIRRNEAKTDNIHLVKKRVQYLIEVLYSIPCSIQTNNLSPRDSLLRRAPIFDGNPMTTAPEITNRTPEVFGY